MRIVINTGPVVGAVIGSNKFTYDVYGDAVNTASRMESQGVPGHIQVTETTYTLLQDRYAFEERGTVPVKGKGKGEGLTYLLVGRCDEAVQPQREEAVSTSEGTSRVSP
jgi:class 3 adenylate cyclase